MKTIYVGLLCSAIALSSCAKGVVQSSALKDPQYAQAQQQINAKNFDGAITSLEDLAKRYPESQEVKRKLMHAHAGAAGFESAKFKEQMQALLKSGDEFKLPKLALDSLKSDLKSAKNLDPAAIKRLELYRVTGALKNLLSSAPTLDSPQYAHLSRALRLYDEMGFKPETSSADDNFKWGVLYAFRIVATARNLADALDGLARDPERSGRGDVNKFTISAVDHMGRDALKALQLFSHSYAKIRDISGASKHFVERTTGAKIRAELLEEGRPLAQILREAAKDNRELVASYVTTVQSQFETYGFEDTIRLAFSKFKGDSAELALRKDRIRAIVRVLIDDLKTKHSGETEEARILSKQVWEELAAAADESGKQKSLAPLEQALRDNRSQLHRVLEIGRALADNYKDSEITSDMKAQVIGLREMVEREQLIVLKEHLLSLRETLGYTNDAYRTQAQDLLRLQEEQIKNHGEQLNSTVRGELSASLEELKVSVNKKDADLDNAGKQAAKDAKQFIGK